MRTAADYVEEHRITTVKNMANMLLYSIETMRTTFQDDENMIQTITGHIDQVCVILGCLGQRDILEADRLREDLENELRQGLDWECD